MLHIIYVGDVRRYNGDTMGNVTYIDHATYKGIVTCQQCYIEGHATYAGDVTNSGHVTYGDDVDTYRDNVTHAGNVMTALN